MRVPRGLTALLVPLVLAAYLTVATGVWDQRGTIRRSAEAGYVIPSRFSRVLALEHKGLLADFLLLKTITFFGERVVHGQPLSEDDWQYIVGSLESVTDLDPYFFDPYYLAEGLLTWESGKYEEANRLLKKGWNHRPDNWIFPFYIGFNYFYFLKDSTSGAEYLMEASRLPGSPNFLSNLAARISYYGGKSKTAIVFLKSLLDQMDDEQLRNAMEKRLTALERAASLEEAAEAFLERYGRKPQSIDELMERGIVATLPAEPYGGEWIILENGRVFSTSKFIEQPSGGRQ